MSTHIEWADLNNASPELVPPGYAHDAYGSENDLPALYIGECVIEGTREQWVSFASALLSNALLLDPE